ncbi:helix-turn-helix domain-containing protein [Chryseobacterium camelliae]|uniref:helix-turn-helix domain-containing protein n=1 Tax=Chryseobacterium camelliae TaxID=1265445 RepID=UPI0012FD5C8B|nr:AraC family transcriptional regulator [Chryseobacterium camelliae]
MRLWLSGLWLMMGIFAYGQAQYDRSILMAQAQDYFTLHPEKSEMIGYYIQKNFPDEPSGKEAAYIIIMARYLQNHTSELTDTGPGENNTYPEDYLIAYATALYSAGLNTEILQPYDPSGIVRDMDAITSRLKRKQYRQSIPSIRRLISRTTDQNMNSLKIFWSAVFDTVPLENLAVFRDEISAIAKRYPREAEAILLSARLQIAEKNTDAAKKAMAGLDAADIGKSQNLRLKKDYLDIATLLSFYGNSAQDYIRNKNIRDGIIRNIAAENQKFRSRWYSFTEDNNRLAFESRNKRTGLVLGICLLIISTVIVSLLIYLYNVKNRIKRFELLKSRIKSLSDKKTPLNIIPEKTESLLLDKLTRFESEEDFLSPNMSLNVLAKKLGTNTKYLSETINTCKGKNFNTYINELRINYILTKLNNDPVYRNYKISYLAEECGFSSHSLFASVFKTVVGISPINYIRILNEKR